MRDSRPRADSGTILMLTLGYLVVAAMLAVVVTDVSALYLARRSIASAADGAALAAAQQLDEQALYTGGTAGETLPLAAAQAAVSGYQQRSDPSGATQMTTSLLDGATVEVRASRVVTLPLVGFLGIGPVTVTAAADAESVVRAPAAP